MFRDLLDPRGEEGSNVKVKRDPLRKLTFGDTTLYPFEEITRKQGRPRSVWSQEMALEIIPKEIRERGERTFRKTYGGSDYKYLEECYADVLEALRGQTDLQKVRSAPKVRPALSG